MKQSQSVLDATADAETVRLAAKYRWRLAHALDDAEFYGARVLRVYSKGLDDRIVRSSLVDASYYAAMAAARAAFRACPELRS